MKRRSVSRILDALQQRKMQNRAAKYFIFYSINGALQETGELRISVIEVWNAWKLKKQARIERGKLWNSITMLWSSRKLNKKARNSQSNSQLHRFPSSERNLYEAPPRNILRVRRKSVRSTNLGISHSRNNTSFLQLAQDNKKFDMLNLFEGNTMVFVSTIVGWSYEKRANQRQILYQTHKKEEDLEIHFH
jgi:hypothetical protein